AQRGNTAAAPENPAVWGRPLRRRPSLPSGPAGETRGADGPVSGELWRRRPHPAPAGPSGSSSTCGSACSDPGSGGEQIRPPFSSPLPVLTNPGKAVSAPVASPAGNGTRGAASLLRGRVGTPSAALGAARDLVSWRDVRKTGLVFGTTLLLLLSLAAFSVISVVSYLVLALLSVTISFRVYKSVVQAVQKSEEGHPFKAYLDLDIALSSEAFHNYVNAAMVHVNRALRLVIRLFLVEDLVDSLKASCSSSPSRSSTRSTRRRSIATWASPGTRARRWWRRSKRSSRAWPRRSRSKSCRERERRQRRRGKSR
uniref:Reticulon n=1 Tax=Apteryx owenii TaxID=8824 RepID=A0A8B9PCQ1_APTOW